MFKNLRESLNQRKVQIFLLFLLVAFLLRLVSKLSEQYTKQSNFWISYTNQPDSIFIKSSTRDQIPVRLEASGFNFLSYTWQPKVVQIDLSRLSFRNRSYYVPKSDFQGQIEDQLSGSMRLLDIGVDTLFIDYVSVKEKTVPVRVSMPYEAAQNHLIDGNIRIDPAEVTIKGPHEEIDSIQSVATLPVERAELDADFEFKEKLRLDERLEYTVLQPSSVTVSGTIYRFSEKLIEIPVTVLNVPQGTEIKTFPESVKILCRAKSDRLKALSEADFSATADYEQLTSDQLLRVSLQVQPEDVPSVQLLDTQLEFILRRL